MLLLFTSSLNELVFCTGHKEEPKYYLRTISNVSNILCRMQLASSHAVASIWLSANPSYLQLLHLWYLCIHLIYPSHSPQLSYLWNKTSSYVGSYGLKESSQHILHYIVNDYVPLYILYRMIFIIKQIVLVTKHACSLPPDWSQRVTAAWSRQIGLLGLGRGCD